MRKATYVLVTPARNEAATIEETIKSVLSQSHLPVEWVIVSDGSTDRTDEIVREYSRMHTFLRLLRLEGRPMRGFASVVFATESGVKVLHTKDYDFIGLLDADVRFQSNYFELVLERFSSAPKLGLAGGLVVDVGGGRIIHQYMKDVAGAVQCFRRDCFFSRWPDSNP